MKQIFLLATTLMLSACSTINTSSDYNPEINFKQYTSYAWISRVNDNSEYRIDGLLDARVREAVETELGSKGLQKESLQNASLLVNYLTQIDTKLDVEAFTYRYGYKPNHSYRRSRSRRGGLLGYTHSQISEYQVSTLTIDLIDADTKELVWRGSLVDRVKSYKTPQARTEAINQAVAQILMNYPPDK